MPAMSAGSCTCSPSASMPLSIEAATEMAPGPTAGELVTYAAVLPLLPDAATTTVPTRVALCDAIAVGSSGWPKSEPRLMLITSAWPSMLPSPLGSRDHSMASAVTAVEPASSPNTSAAYSDAPGATPVPTVALPSTVSSMPAAVPATWVPWPNTSIGFGSGCGTSLVGSLASYSVPAKSKPRITLAVGQIGTPSTSGMTVVSLVASS